MRKKEKKKKVAIQKQIRPGEQECAIPPPRKSRISFDIWVCLGRQFDRILLMKTRAINWRAQLLVAERRFTTVVTRPPPAAIDRHSRQCPFFFLTLFILFLFILVLIFLLEKVNKYLKKKKRRRPEVIGGSLGQFKGRVALSSGTASHRFRPLLAGSWRPLPRAFYCRSPFVRWSEKSKSWAWTEPFLPLHLPV